ncbi:RNA polymerase sigma factor [Mesobacillus zeae]|uniref:RNA polymerase sigma factor n=1 Tax=Mesobacillus zeae TaxID=1917180 RepID=A0A398B5E3_9BACI|nr:RNA polymerase sigma factor [Mesobacillus zeae]RID82923.1 RNA polymerase sigma factor [Mesobacillus zeae]
MGNYDAFTLIEEVYREHYLYLKHFLLKLSSDEKLAEDIIQEVFSKILLHPNQIFDVKYMRSWLITSAKNLLIDHYRKKAPSLLNDSQIIDTLLISENTPEKSLLQKSAVEALLQNVSEEDRKIFLLKEHDGYKYEEISALLEIPVSTIKSRIFRLRKSILSKVNRSDFNE